MSTSTPPPIIRLFVATPTYGGMATTQYMAATLRLQEYMTQRGISVRFMFIVNESLITRARNSLCHTFLQSDCTHMLFLDADIGYDAEDIFRMIVANVDVIGGSYPKKEINWKRVHEMAKLGAPTETLSAVASNFVFNPLNANAEYKIYEPNEVQEVGTGVLLIKRDVFTKMKEKYDDWYLSDDNLNNKQKIYRFFDTQVVNGRYLSEDYMFAHRWREMGGKIYLAAWTRTTHSGMYSFVGDIVATANAMNSISIQDTPEVAEKQPEETPSKEKKTETEDA